MNLNLRQLLDAMPATDGPWFILPNGNIRDACGRCPLVGLAVAIRGDGDPTFDAKESLYDAWTAATVIGKINPRTLQTLMLVADYRPVLRSPSRRATRAELIALLGAKPRL